MGGEHSGIADDTTTRVSRRRVLESRGDPGQDAPPRLRERRRLPLRARRRLRSARARVERATQLILEICGGRAGPARPTRSATLPARPPVRVRTRARRASCSASRCRAGRDRRHLHAARACRTREAATTSSSRRRRTASTSRSRRTSSRRSRASTATTRFRRRRAAHVQTMLPSPEARRSAFALQARGSPRATGRKSITFSFVAVGDERALDPAARADRAC